MLRQKTVYYSLGFPFNIIEHPATSQEARVFGVSAFISRPIPKDIMNTTEYTLNAFAWILPRNGTYTGKDLACSIVSSYSSVRALHCANVIEGFTGKIIRRNGRTTIKSL